MSYVNSFVDKTVDRVLGFPNNVDSIKPSPHWEAAAGRELAGANRSVGLAEAIRPFALPVAVLVGWFWSASSTRKGS